MRRLTGWFGAGMGFLLISGVVAYAGQKVTEDSHPGYKVPGVPFPVNFDPAIFDETSINIDNEWWPLPPGKQMTWEGTALDDEGEEIPRKVVFTVTDMTKMIAGVRTVVGWDRDYQDGELTESELIFLAQSKDGAVWHLGESVEHFEGRPEINAEEHYDGTRVWLVGYLEGCKAGYYMPAEPKVGMPPYSQGFAPSPWDWDDWAEVYQVGQKVSTPAGDFSDVLVIREWEPSAPGGGDVKDPRSVSQTKHYARGVGTVAVGWMGEQDEEQEEMKLVKNVMLSPEELAEVRAVVRVHESRANMYSLTPPAEQRK